jgi:hypothetical protein
MIPFKSNVVLFSTHSYVLTFREEHVVISDSRSIAHKMLYCQLRLKLLEIPRI